MSMGASDWTKFGFITRSYRSERVIDNGVCADSQPFCEPIQWLCPHMNPGSWCPDASSTEIIGKEGTINHLFKDIFSPLPFREPFAF